MRRRSILLLALILGFGCGRKPGDTRLVLAATTSLEDTGLLDYLAAEFAKAHPEIELVPIAVGTGQAIALGRRHDADVLVSHDSVAETQLVLDGVAAERRSVMHNDFVIAGPAADPARIRGIDAIAAVRRIASTRTPFVSRADDSGTYRKEMMLWQEARIEPARNPAYIQAGLGMGDALLLAGEKRAYILTDRGTYLRFEPRVDLVVLCEHDDRLLNKYGVTVMNGKRIAAAEIFADWITSPEVRQKIGAFGKAEFGQSLFVPSGPES